MSNEPVLSVRNLQVTYGTGEDAVEAIGDVTLDVHRGEFVCVVGPSGAGKTTLLKAMAGLLRPSGGEVLVEGEPVDGPPAHLAMVFQEYTRSLFPWLTVRANVSFPLEAKGVGRKEARDRADAALEQVRLTGFGDKHPWQLSGGMQQRVAIARAVAYEPAVLLMDEPFASVDAQTRAELEDLMLSVQESAGLTVLFVTHDIDESIYLGERVIVLSARPTTVRTDHPVDLPRPRDQLATKALPEFVELRTEVLRLIREGGSAPPADGDLLAPAPTLAHL